MTGRDLTMPRDAIERSAFTLIPSIAVRLFLRSCLNDRDAELDEIRERYAELEQHSAHYAARADDAARERDAALDRIRHLEQRPAPFVDDQDGALEALNARIEAVRESLRRHGYEHTTMRPVAGSEELGPVLLRSDVIEFVDEIRASVDPSCAPPPPPPPPVRVALLTPAGAKVWEAIIARGSCLELPPGLPKSDGYVWTVET